MGEIHSDRKNTRREGSLWEEKAAQYLQEQGVRLVSRNFRSRQGEIDIVGYHGEYLIFVEVKYRKSGRQGSAASAVGFAKQRTICKVSDYYRCVHGINPETPIRFDVAAIDGDSLHWIQNAFPYIG